MRIQLVPNVVGYENRICLTRVRWERGTVGDGKGYSSKASVSILFEPRDMWIGLFWKVTRYFKMSKPEICLWICLLPCLPIRIKIVRSYGGVYP